MKIVRREFIEIVRKKSFLIGLFLVPVFVAASVPRPRPSGAGRHGQAEAYCGGGPDRDSVSAARSPLGRTTQGRTTGISVAGSTARSRSGNHAATAHVRDQRGKPGRLPGRASRRFREGRGRVLREKRERYPTGRAIAKRVESNRGCPQARPAGAGPGIGEKMDPQGAVADA